MDQNQQLSSMDPQLREAYERVMGMNAKPAAQTSSPAQSVPSSSISSQAQDTLTSEEKPLVSDLHPVTPIQNNTPPQNTHLDEKTAVSSPPPEIHTTVPHPESNATSSGTDNAMKAPAHPQANHMDSPPSPENTPAFDPVVANNQMHAYVAQEVAGAKQSIKTIQLIYIVGGIVFFLVYALFWMKFFNVSSPF